MAQRHSSAERMRYTRAMRPASVLDGFFSDSVERVVAANRALRSDDIGDADRSWGAIGTAEALSERAREFHANGILSEVIFGPRHVLCCGCGALRGQEHRDQRCASCGVLCADPLLRAWRFGHVDTPVLIHPLLLGKVSEALSLPIAELHRVLNLQTTLDGQRGGRAIKRKLETSTSTELVHAACLTRVPVPPAGERPLVERLSASHATPWIGPLNEEWLAFTRHCLIARSWADRGGSLPRQLLVGERSAQRAFARVMQMMTTTTPLHDWHPWERVDEGSSDLIALGAVPPIATGGAPEGYDVERLHCDGGSLVFVDEVSFLLQLRFHVQHIDLDGSVLHSFPSPLRRLRSVHGPHVVFEGWQLPPTMRAFPGGFDAAAALGSASDVAIYDLSRAAYLTSWPSELPAFGVIRDAAGATERALIDRRTGAILEPRWRGKGPAIQAWTHDARFLWSGDTEHESGVVEVATNIPHVVLSVDRESIDDYGGMAVGLTEAHEWRFIHEAGLLSDHATRRDQLGSARAYAFSPTCSHIVRLRGVHGGPQTVDVLDADGRQLRMFEVAS